MRNDNAASVPPTNGKKVIDVVKRLTTLTTRAGYRLLCVLGKFVETFMKSMNVSSHFHNFDNHGQWLPWLKANVPFHQTQAARYHALL